MPSSAAESLYALSSWKIFRLLPLCLMVLCPVVSLWMFENLVKYEKKKKQTKKKLRKASNNFFQVLPLLREPFYFRQKFWLFWIIIIIIIIIIKWWPLLHPSFFSNVYIFVLLYFLLTHATSRPPLFWATHVNRKWSFLPHQIFIPLPDNVTALSKIIAWPRCWNGRSTSAGHVC